ncbi:type II CAAX endopeptidase family protein [soil metagenome]
MNYILFDTSNRLRSGWRAGIFLFAFTIAAVALGAAGQAVMSAMHIESSTGTATILVVNGILSLIPAILIGWLCGRLLEKLPFRALGAAFTHGWFNHWILGLVIGAATLSFAVLIAFAAGGLRFAIDNVDKSALLSSLGISFAIFAVAAAFEEALFRGYILQTFSRSGLAWLAILLTSVFFGAVHLGNPGAGIISTTNTILAGIWFSVAYLKTRDLWFVWGLHLMWNWMQGSIFGIEVSGLTGLSTAPLLREIDGGPQWLTGETYGIEASIVCTIALIVSTAAIYLLPIFKPDEELLAMTSKTRSCDS